MANITGNWDKTKPAGSDPVSQGDDRLRTHWGSLEDGIEEEHYFSDSETSAGIHKKGSAKVFCDNLSNLSTGGADDTGRLYYAIDDESLHILGESSTTKISGSQQGGPVRSVTSATRGWYISSYRTAQKQSPSAYSYINAAGSPTLVYKDTPQVLGVTWEQPSSSGTSTSVAVVYSVTSSHLKCTIARYSNIQEDTSTVAAGFEASGLVSGFLHVSVMGLLPLSELS